MANPIQRGFGVVTKKYTALTYDRKILCIVFLLLLFLSLAMRWSLRHVATSDYIIFVQPWLDHMKQYGIAGLGTINSNYNAPYLMLLWLGGKLHLADLATVKVISVVFDYILAYGVYLVVRYYRPRGIVKYIAPLAILFAPTVLINGSLWGQCDSIYTSFLVYAFYAFLKNKQYAMWMLWGVAFAFKLQAVFFLPFLIMIFVYKRNKIWAPIAAALVIIVLSLPPLLYGKSLADIINIYVGQTAPIQGLGLAVYSPTVYQLFTIDSPQIRKVGIMFTGAVALILMSAVFIRKFTPRSTLILATLFVTAIPFFLPEMHERYFFVAEIFLIITACVVPRFVLAAIAMQLITVLSYVPYLSADAQMPVIPYAYLAVGVMAIIGSLGYYLYRHTIRIDMSVKELTYK